jgi:hypothetical protein
MSCAKKTISTQSIRESKKFTILRSAFWTLERGPVIFAAPAFSHPRHLFTMLFTIVLGVHGCLYLSTGGCLAIFPT